MAEMKPDLMYVDDDLDIERFIEAGIAELETLCSSEKQYDENNCFEQLSHTKFALQILLREIREHPNVSPCSIIVRFANRMDQYSYKNIKTSPVFSAAYDTAISVLEAIGEYS